MARKYLWLAVGLLLAAGAAGRADDKSPAPQPAPEAVAPGGPAVVEDAAAPAAMPTPPPAFEGSAPPVGAPCCKCCQGHARGDCLRRLGAWLTYCPPKTPCHCGLCKCGGCGGCGGCGQKCTPCCIPLYMYFLDRCDCRLGFPPVCCPPPCPPANAGPGPAPAATSQAAPPAPEPLPAPVPLDGAANPQATSGR